MLTVLKLLICSSFYKYQDRRAVDVEGIYYVSKRNGLVGAGFRALRVGVRRVGARRIRAGAAGTESARLGFGGALCGPGRRVLVPATAAAALFARLDFLGFLAQRLAAEQNHIIDSLKGLFNKN